MLALGKRTFRYFEQFVLDAGWRTLGNKSSHTMIIFTTIAELRIAFAR